MADLQFSSLAIVKSLLMIMGPLLSEELTEDDIVTVACVMPPPRLLISRNHCTVIELASRIACRTG